jgi:hypothetical protein
MSTYWRTIAICGPLLCSSLVAAVAQETSGGVTGALAADAMIPKRYCAYASQLYQQSSFMCQAKHLVQCAPETQNAKEVVWIKVGDC